VIRILILFCSLFLSACGGGSSSDSTQKNTNISSTASEKIKNARNHSAQELKQAAKSLVTARYTGIQADAEIDIKFAQKAFLYLFGSDETEAPEVVNEYLKDLVDSNGNIDVTLMCDYQGSVDYKGHLDSSYKGNLSLTYNSCNQSENGFAINGNVAATITKYSEDMLEITYYYDKLTWVTSEKTTTLTGYSLLKSSRNNAGYTEVANELDVLFKIGSEEQIRLEALVGINQQGNNNPIEMSGDLYIAKQGKVSFQLENVYDIPPYINSGKLELSGTSNVAFEFGNQFIRYVADDNNDGTYDIGTYFYNASELIDGNVEHKQLVALSVLSLPPRVNSPRSVYNKRFDTTTPVEVRAGSYSDPDTQQEQLTVSYHWYINDQLIEGEATNTLPPYLAVFGDKLEVAMLVSDGANSIESRKLSITLEDAPAEIIASNLPEKIVAGETVSFIVQITDPDTGNSKSNGALAAAPDGTTINADGLVNWTVPSELMLSHQTYNFTFGIPDTNGNINDTKTITLLAESEKSLPLARSGVEVPKGNKSMSVGDFDGDGKNEVLSTDGYSSVFLLEFDGQNYRQKWTYPYKVAGHGRIIQVLSANLDDDDELEIIIVTQHGISVLNNLNSLAKPVMTTENNLKLAAIEDINQDGVMELAYLYSTSEHSGDTLVDIFSMNNVEQSLFNTNVSSAVQLIFANVDEDENIELVLNNGLVYDTATWQNEWFSGTSFGNRSVTAGDYDGDGIMELVGADTWGAISVYSADDKSQLYSFDNFNTCTLDSDDVDGDQVDELLVGDCQWGNITAYKLINGKLVTLWEVNMQGHGSVSLTTGDSDNDGNLEVHWGTGVSSSGKDGFITADITNSTIAIKEEAASIQLDSYSSAGWSTTIGNEEKAVFFIPETGSGYDGSRLALLDSNGNISLTEEISSNWDNSAYAVTTDFNNDGLGDIFLPSTQLYNGSFAAMQIHDETIHWQTSGDHSSKIGVIKTVDLNQDSFDDAIYADSKVLKVIDIQHQTIIGNYTFNNYIKDFSAFVINNVKTVVVAHGEKLSLLTHNGATFSEQAFKEQSCSRVELINYDNDDDLELICLQGDANYSYQTQQLVVYDLNDSSLTEIERNNVTEKIIDIVVDPSKSQEQNLFITTESTSSPSYNNYESDYYVKKTNAKGLSIWSSLALVGRPTSHGLKVRKDNDNKLEMLISTSSTMYWIK